jgi:hypothetical protein
MFLNQRACLRHGHTRLTVHTLYTARVLSVGSLQIEWVTRPGLTQKSWIALSKLYTSRHFCADCAAALGV